MSEKMSINIEVLGINTIHNYIVPSNMSVFKIIGLITKTLLEEYSALEENGQTNHLLIQANSGKVLTSNCSLSQLGIVNGEKLVFI